MVEKRSNKEDSKILIQYEKVRTGDVVKLGDFYTGEHKIERTTEHIEPRFYYTSRQVENLFNGEYMALYWFDFVEPLSEIEEFALENGKYNLNKEVKMLDVGFMRVVRE